jgi:hypothetical protein
VSKTTTNDAELRGYISLADAARILGTSTQAISNLAHKGRFRTKTVAGRMLVLHSEIVKFAPRPKGRPAKGAQTVKDTPLKPLERTDETNVDVHISQSEAARIRGVSKQAIANLIRRGRLNAASVAGRTLVLRSEVETFVAKPKNGRPPKNAGNRTIATQTMGKKAAKRGRLSPS